MTSDYTFDEPLRRRFSRNLNSFARHTLEDPALRRAGVALVVAEADDCTGACLLLTRRSKMLRRHAGQYALPGGRLDDGETFEQAALRELSEELGLDYGPEAVIGALDDYATQSGFCIRPFVVWGGSLAAMKPDPIEVAVVFQIPLAELDNPAIPTLTPSDDPDRPILGAPIAATGHVVHAPTAALIYQFREVAMHGRATRVAHFGQPQFAWK
ncbi:MAG: CoA pyrophosphatase [Alphaproteobacteria bacterium]|nr:CoA pyrophosphatase [Alphaproteobacteria bacterium]